MEELLLGTANVFLQSLAYSLDFADEICIVDYKVSKGQEKENQMNFDVFLVISTHKELLCKGSV